MSDLVPVFTLFSERPDGFLGTAGSSGDQPADSGTCKVCTDCASGTDYDLDSTRYCRQHYASATVCSLDASGLDGLGTMFHHRLSVR